MRRERQRDRGDAAGTGKRREGDASARAETLTFDILLLDETGKRLGEILGLALKRAPREALTSGGYCL